MEDISPKLSVVKVIHVFSDNSYSEVCGEECKKLVQNWEIANSHVLKSGLFKRVEWKRYKAKANLPLRPINFLKDVGMENSVVQTGCRGNLFLSSILKEYGKRLMEKIL